MARVLLAWELGGGLGHLGRLVRTAHLLRSMGHEVGLAAREHARAAPWFQAGVVLPAPVVSLSGHERIREPASLAEVLFNAGARDDATLEALVAGWHRLLDAFAPQVVVMDYSPFALLALQGRSTRKVLLGTGFATPPNVSPLPDLRPWQGHYPDRLWFNEILVRDLFNARLAGQRCPALERLAELFVRVDANLLATFPELDHYPDRTPEANTDYIGTCSEIPGIEPDWPAGAGPRVFAYLKPFPALVPLLEYLSDRGIRALVHLAGAVPGLPEPLPGIQITREPVAIARAAHDADLAILNAGHGTTAEMLLAGTPILEVPLLVEQGMVADRVCAIGAGLQAPLDDSKTLLAALERMLHEASFRVRARAFAKAHAVYDPDAAARHTAERIAALASERLPGGGQ